MGRNRKGGVSTALPSSWIRFLRLRVNIARLAPCSFAFSLKGWFQVLESLPVSFCCFVIRYPFMQPIVVLCRQATKLQFRLTLPFFIPVVCHYCPIDFPYLFVGPEKGIISPGLTFVHSFCCKKPVNRQAWKSGLQGLNISSVCE